METRIMPNVSVISIALAPEEFEPLHQTLAQQTYRDFEFVGEVGGTIPEAWNRAIDRAQGEILVFTETDATPVDERWLEQLVNSVPDEKTVVKGLEIVGSPWDLANLAAHRDVFANARFDESFLWAEDTELFCRLKQQGYQLLRVDTAPVIHHQKLGSKRMLRRAFRYGLYQARLRLMYDRDAVDIAGITYVGSTLLRACLNLAGLAAGYIVYWPMKMMGKMSSSTNRD
jgi:GT2 family glycosyltransferase